MMPSASPPATAENVLVGLTNDEVDEDTRDNGRDADERVDRKARETCESSVTCQFGQVHADSHAERRSDNGGDTHKNRRAQQRWGDAAACLADGGRFLDEKIPVERADSMNDQVSEDREKRAKRKQSRQSR